MARFADAFENGSVEQVIALLTDDAWVAMPPEPFEYQGHAAIAQFFAQAFGARGDRVDRLVATRANGQPAFGHYIGDAYAPVVRGVGVIVLTLEGDAIAAITWFADTGIFRHFGLPRIIPSP